MKHSLLKWIDVIRVITVNARKTKIKKYVSLDEVLWFLERYEERDRQHKNNKAITSSRKWRWVLYDTDNTKKKG